MALLKQSGGYSRTFILVQTSDHITGLSGATPSGSISKAGGAFALPGGSITEIGSGNGFYKISYIGADTGTLGDLAIHITASGGDPTDFVDQVVAFDPGDAIHLGLSAIPNASDGSSGGLPILSNSGVLQTYPTSGQVWLASGSVTATVLSGQVWLASGSQVIIQSGQVYLASGSITSGVISSGIYVTTTIASGQVYLASGSQTIIQSGQVFLASGTQVLVQSGQLSGQPIAGLSGFIYPASGIDVTVPISTLSGITVTLVSGTTYLASGSTVLVLSGQIYPASGSTFIASGAYVPIQSGQVFLASGSVTSGVIDSGIYVTVPTPTLSGVVANSGLNVTVPISTISGVIVSVESGQVWLSSGQSISLNSGQFVLIYSGQISGQPINNITINSGSFPSGLLTVTIPQSILELDFSGLPSTPKHTLVNAARKLINRWDTTMSSGELVVYLEDDATAAYTQSVGTQSGAIPIVNLRTD